VILAISLDESRRGLTEVVEMMKVPGIQTWDEKGRDNPVADLYNVQRLPAWFLLDDKGVIRARDPFGEKLIPAIQSLLVPSKQTEDGPPAAAAKP
jgi:hypothetical protein